MAIHQYLDCSISHISSSDNDLLIAGIDAPDTPFLILGHEHGYWLNVPTESLNEYLARYQNMIDYGFGEGMLTLYAYASVNQCNWINLDSDGEVLPNRKIYEW